MWMEEIAAENEREIPSPRSRSFMDREGKSKGHICMSGSIWGIQGWVLWWERGSFPFAKRQSQSMLYYRDYRKTRIEKGLPNPQPWNSDIQQFSEATSWWLNYMYRGSTMVLSFYIAILHAVQSYSQSTFLSPSVSRFFFFICKSFLVICSVILKSKRFITKHFSSLISWAVIF